MPSSPSPAGAPPAPARAAPCARTRFGGSGGSLLPSQSGSFSGTASRNPNEDVELRSQLGFYVLFAPGRTASDQPVPNGPGASECSSESRNLLSVSSWGFSSASPWRPSAAFFSAGSSSRSSSMTAPSNRLPGGLPAGGLRK